MQHPKGSAFPEFLTRDDVDNGAWEVRPSVSPSTNIHDRKMLVPLGRDQHSRVIRARELMRAKVGVDKYIIPNEYKSSVNTAIVDACEEFRLNTLLNKVGISPDDLDTRHLPLSVDRAIAADDVVSLADAIVRSYGTKANDTVARAIRTSAKRLGKPGAAQFAKNLRRAIKNDTDYWSSPWYTSSLSDTEPMTVTVDEDRVTMPSGYRFTLSLAHTVSRLLSGPSASAWGEGPNTDRKGIPGEGGLPEEVGDMPNSFADLVLDKLHLTERVAGRMGRKRSATNMGINPRRIHRYLVDPERRIFDKRIKGIGGVVLIDQSGSMRLDTDDIWEIIKASPGATIIGYSHGHGEPNCWVLAENGKVVAEVRHGNGGNGVDGPALMYALSKRKKGEPIVWVCDGVVTDRNDECHRGLTEWCAKVVVKHKVYMAEDVPEAVEALKQVRDGRVLPTRAVGPIYSSLERMSASVA